MLTVRLFIILYVHARSVKVQKMSVNIAITTKVYYDKLF